MHIDQHKIHRKLKTGQYERHHEPALISASPEGLLYRAQVAPDVLLKVSTYSMIKLDDV